MGEISNETRLILQLLTERAKAKSQEFKEEQMGSERGNGFEEGAKWVIDEAKQIVDKLEKET